MLLNYGRGRFEQLFRDFNKKNLIFTLPAFFSTYILLTPFVFLLYLHTNNIITASYFIPLIIYFLITLLAGIITSLKDNGLKNKIIGLFIYPFMFFITHFFYGLGFFYCLIRIITGFQRVAKFSIKKHKSFE